MNDFDQKNWLLQQPFNCAPSSPCLLILMGLSGSGKSTVSRFLAKQYNAVWINSDIERQQRYGAQADMYSPAITRKLFADMTALANQLLRENYPVIIDSCALKAEERDSFRKTAGSIHCPTVLIYCQAPENELKNRIRLRLQSENDPSQAQPELIDLQKRWLEPPSIEEKQSLIRINISEPDWQNRLNRELNLKL